jgi:hypothetical protein
MWAINTTTVYASRTWGATPQDLEHFVTNAESIVIDTGDSAGLVGMVEFGARLMVFGKKKAYYITDEETDSTKWGFVPTQWDGGVAHFRLLVKTPNDVIAMAEDGEVYSIAAVEQYGDYKQASLTKDSWMHDYIKDYVDLNYVEHFHGIYDPELRAVKILVCKKGHTTPNEALVYFIDRAPKDAWMVHDNETYASGYDATCSTIVRVATGSYKPYTGGPVGFVWKLNQTTKGDNGYAYYAGFKTPNDPLQQAAVQKMFNVLRIYFELTGDTTMGLRVWVDQLLKLDTTFDMEMGVPLDSFILGTDKLATEELNVATQKLGFIGERIQYEIYNETVLEDFFIGEYMTDFKVMGVRQES